ncbi:MAG: inositol monophosphatase [Alphaproteobacteria bacterium]|nr:inositol monophosphatase family protein [Alphaproteobacteria bacterium]TAD91455.1 MAG: inositol monophosphatase [Alphaproteobacteria bacterium]
MRVTSKSALINVMARAAEKAGRGLIRDFGEVEHLQVSRKGPADFVSQADLRAERMLREELAKVRPDFGFLMEESGESPGRGSERWIVDPLDGTTNFLHGIPHWAVSIAAERDGEIIAGVVYDAAKDELFWAERGGGAFVNDRRLRVAARRDLPSTLIGTGIPFLGVGDHPKYLASLARVMAQTAGVRRNGAAALDLCWVAAGRFDGFWEYGLKPWDVAAGMLIVREAGGFVTEIGGGANPVFGGSVIAANDHLMKPLTALILGT